MNLADRVRGVLRPAPAVTSAAAAPVPTAGAIEDVLGGEWRDECGAPCLVVEQRVTADAHYGRTRVGDMATRLEAASDDAFLLTRGAPARGPFLFFDLETTGLNGGAGTYAFLVGCGSFDADGTFVTKQYVMAKYGDERAVLHAFARELSAAGALVSFNGKSYDAPVIETRYLFHRLEWTGAELPHLDVLHPARRFWGASTCSLVNLEEQVLGARRLSDVPGFEIPARYFQFVRSGDARGLAAILEHNRQDLLSLAGLTARLLWLVAAGPREASDAREALALGHIYAISGLDARARDALVRAIQMVERGSGAIRAHAELTIAALHALALCERRGRRYEEAALRWRAMLDVPGCPPHLARQATEALAIHHEHRVRDLAAARAFALRSLDGGSAPGWRDGVHRRLARISRKMGCARLPLESACGRASPTLK